jgi:hypothetical protein
MIYPKIYVVNYFDLFLRHTKDILQPFQQSRHNVIEFRIYIAKLFWGWSKEIIESLCKGI